MSLVKTNGTPIISVQNLHKEFLINKKAEKFSERFSGFFKKRDPIAVEAVNDISFEVEEGEILAFIGPNGAGKSTTIKMLTGILFPTNGKVSVLGLTPWCERKALSFRIGTVFGQKSQLMPHLPPIDTFKLLGAIFEMDPKQYEKRRDYLFECFEIKDIAKIPARKLSLGQRMRCEIAAGLIHNPDVIFLDEPTIGLDPVVKSSIRRLIKRANEEEKVTVFLTSHDTGDIEKLCRRSIIINHGTMIYDGTVNHLRRAFLTSKVLGIKVAGDFRNDENMPNGVKVLKSKNGGAKLSVDTKEQSIESVIKYLMSGYTIEDLTIEDTPLEEVISSIYKKGKVEGH